MSLEKNVKENHESIPVLVYRGLIDTDPSTWSEVLVKLLTKLVNDDKAKDDAVKEHARKLLNKWNECNVSDVLKLASFASVEPICQTHWTGGLTGFCPDCGKR